MAAIQRARRGLGLRQAVVVANPLPPEEAMDPLLHDRVLIDALTRAEEQGVVPAKRTVRVRRNKGAKVRFRLAPAPRPPAIAPPTQAPTPPGTGGQPPPSSRPPAG